MLSLGIYLLSCWIPQCHRGLGLVMQIMTLYLPRRDRLGRDQLHFSSCLEPDTVWRLSATCCWSSKPVSLVSHRRRKGCCWKCRFHSWGDPRAHSWCREVQRTRSVCVVEFQWAGHRSWRAADKETRKVGRADLRFLWILIWFCWLCHCHDLQTPSLLWHGCMNVLCTVPTPTTKSDYLYENLHKK